MRTTVGLSIDFLFFLRSLRRWGRWFLKHEIVRRIIATSLVESRTVPRNCSVPSFGTTDRSATYHLTSLMIEQAGNLQPKIILQKSELIGVGGFDIWLRGWGVVWGEMEWMKWNQNRDGDRYRERRKERRSRGEIVINKRFSNQNAILETWSKSDRHLM